MITFLLIILIPSTIIAILGFIDSFKKDENGESIHWHEPDGF